MGAEAAAGATVVSVLHELTLALAADALLVLAGGRVVAHGPADDAAVRAALSEVFDHALRFERVPDDGGVIWAALPQLSRRDERR